MNLYALSVNHRANPLGINSDEQPYFGWKLKSEKPNTMQAAYRLRIYADDTVCFDSGRVETACNAFVCGPDLLRPQTFYRWAVTVWDNHGENTTAESSFETSLSFKEWKADWMRTPRAYVQRKKGFGTQPPATLFRRAFTLSAAPRRARLYATCLGVYRLTVNGKRPDMREFAPEHTSYKGLLCFQTYDLTALLHIGENVLGMEVGDGWYCCPQTQPPIDGLQPDHTVLFQLEIENADGTHTRICSDEGVLTHESAVRASDIFDGELYDARLALPGWDMPGFTAADWLPAVKDTKQSDSVLYPQFDDPVICVKELPAQCVYTSPKGETIVDFGQVVAGRARVTVDLPTGAAVTLEHFEAVDAKGNYFNNIDSAMGITEQKDVFISDGTPQTFEARFTFHGFRYLRVSGVENPLAEQFVAVVLSTEKTNAGTFECSNADLNRLYQNTRWSQCANIYTEQISGKVDKINSGSLELVSLAASSQNYYTSSPLGRYLTQQDILTRLQDRIRYVESSDLYFFYRTDSDELLTALSNRPSTGSSYFWNQYLMLPPTQPANTWFSVTCNGETWLMCYYNVSQVRVGAAVRAKTLLQSLYADTGLVQDSGFALAGLDGTIVYSSQPDLMACGTSLAGHIPASLIVESHTVPEVGTLLLFRPSSDLLHQLSGSFGWLLLLNLLALALITTMLLNTNRHITVPIQQLTEGVREVERGNWDYQLETSSQIEDFQQLFRGFNHMILEVHDLKISAYEAELERHRNELRYLQLQIRPHFYLNAITTISSLIYQDRKQDARSFIDFLSDYLRYLFSGSDTQVPLQQETKHCKSFIQLQQIKYPDTIFYMFELASGTENIRIPKFLLQTVVENIFKHGFSPEQFLSIFLESALEEQNGVRGLRMTVEDNGCGFPPEMLASFPVKEDNGHVGLSNLYHTLQLIYGPAASLHISNAEPNGARVTIFLPEEENHAHPSRG